MGKVILIDGNSLLYRAFFAMPHFSTLENQPTNAVYGFIMMLLRVLEEEKPEIVLVAFDAPAKTFRHDEYKEYKAHRKRAPDELRSQGPLAREAVDAFNIPLLEIEGFEADDVVGTLARKAEKEGYDVVIVTGDLDALQLVDDHVRVMSTVKGVTETVIYDEKAVEERYGLKPEQLPDYKALKGDPSDNIPGVPGIGDKTAVKLLQEYGSLENLLYHTEDIENKKLQNRLVEHAGLAEMSKRLGRIVTDVPLDIDLLKCRYRKPDYPHLRDLFKRLEFRTLLRRLPEETAQGDLFAQPVVETETRAAAERSQRALEFVQPEAPPEVTVIRTPEDLRPVLAEAEKSRGVAVRVKGDTARGVDAVPLGLALAFSPDRAYYVDFAEGIRLEDFRSLLESESLPKYGHNLKYEFELARRSGMDIRGPAFDVMLAGYLLNPSRGTHTLGETAFDYAGIEIVGMPEGAETSVILMLVPILGDRLAQDNLGWLMAEMEMSLVPILADMELAGVAVDRDWLDELAKKLGERIESLEKEIHALAGLEFNVGSPRQLQEVLFEKLGLPVGKKIKTGYSTDADTLAALAPMHPIIGKIMEYRELAKLKFAYADTLPKLINPETGRIHTSLNQAVTATGRLSSSEPNLQHIPIKTEIGRLIRRAFLASPGTRLISADYSQIELRILAHVSRDPELIRAFSKGEDIHTKTATKLFEVPAEEVTPEMRRQAKTVNFAVIYGMSEYGLSRELTIPVSVAKRHIQDYFREYPGVRLYVDETLSRARVRGYVESLPGRRRYIPEINSPNRNYREFAERAAANMPIQGTVADIVKLAMIEVARRLKSGGFKSRLLLQVHDELVLESPESEATRVSTLLREAMEQAFTLDVPLKVEVKSGTNWCDAQPVSAEEHEDLG